MLLAVVESGVGVVISTIVAVIAIVGGLASDNKEGGGK
jgi:hypothetical protein